MEFALRPRQTECLRQVAAAYQAGHRHVLVSLPTGAGKTVVAGAITEAVRRRGQRVMFIAHRHELLTQAREKMRFVLEAQGGDPDDVEIVTSEAAAYEAWVAIASIQRASKWDLGLADREYLLVDECHHGAASTYRRMFERFDHHNPRGRSLGLTATAFRTDDKSLGEIYSTVAYQVDLETLIHEGWLCSLRGKVIELGIDTDSVRRRAGDFDAKDLDRLVNTPEHNAAVVREVQRHAPQGKVVAFAVTVEHAEALANAFTAQGMPAACLHYRVSRKDKDQILADFHHGAYQVLTNVDLLTEGFDEPAVDTVVMVRETLSPIFFTQAIGRGLRLFPGKRECLLLDFTRNCERHTLGQPPRLAPEADQQEDDDTAGQRRKREESDEVEHYRLIDGEFAITPRQVRDVDLLGSKYAWRQVDNDWVLGLGVDDGSLIIHDEDGAGTHCHLYQLGPDRQGRVSLTHVTGPVELSFCMGIAEDEAARHDTYFSQRARTWRNRPPTTAQIAGLRRLGQAPFAQSRGEASARISAAIMRRLLHARSRPAMAG